MCVKCKLQYLAISSSHSSPSLSCAHFLIIAIFHHIFLSLYIKALISLVFFEETAVHICVYTKNASHIILIYMQVCSLHIAGNGDECLMCKEFFILLPSLVLQMTHRIKKFGDEKLHFFHVAHFSAAFIFFHSKRNWWFYCLKCIALRTQRVMRRIFQGFFWWQFLSHTCCNCFLTSKILIASYIFSSLSLLQIYTNSPHTHTHERCHLIRVIA